MDQQTDLRRRAGGLISHENPDPSSPADADRTSVVFQVANMAELRAALHSCPASTTTTIVCAANHYHGDLTLPNKALSLRGTESDGGGRPVTRPTPWWWPLLCCRRRRSELELPPPPVAHFTGRLSTQGGKGAVTPGAKLKIEHLRLGGGLDICENDYKLLQVENCHLELPEGEYADCVRIGKQGGGSVPVMEFMDAGSFFGEAGDRSGGAASTSQQHINAPALHIVLRNCVIRGGRDAVDISLKGVLLDRCTIVWAALRGVVATQFCTLRNCVIRECGEYGLKPRSTFPFGGGKDGCRIEGSETFIQPGPWDTRGRAGGMCPDGSIYSKNADLYANLWAGPPYAVMLNGPEQEGEGREAGSVSDR